MLGMQQEALLEAAAQLSYTCGSDSDCLSPGLLSPAVSYVASMLSLCTAAMERCSDSTVPAVSCLAVQHLVMEQALA